MTQEEKRLLFKDLCAKFPYGVKFPYHKEEDSNHRECDCVATLYSINEYSVEFDYSDNGFLEREWSCTLSEVKPFLRPMSSMTEEEFKEYHSMLIDVDKSGLMNQGLITKIVDWLDEKMFDHRGLIPKGLALEAPEGMYKN